METRRIPNTDLDVSPICLGTMTFGTPVGEADAITLTHWVLDHGINFIDTANMYEGYARYIGSPGGVAEEILGKALAGRRERVVLATKVGNKIGPNDDDEGLGRAHVVREIDRSLKRLRTDYVDLYYMHRPDPNTPLAESIEVFNELIDAGKVRHWAFSNYPADEMERMLRLCDENGWRRPVVCQPPFSLLKPDAERDILPLCKREHIGVVPYQILRGGLLTGKYSRGAPPPEGSRLAEKPAWLPELDDELFAKLEKIEAEAEAADRTMLAHAILETLARDPVVSVIIGAKRIEQVEAALNVLP